MDYNKKRTRILVIILVIIILIAVSIFLYFKFYKKAQPTTSGLTNEQKINILNSLNESSKEVTITDKESLKILKDLDTGSVQTKPLTEEERINLLNSLNQ